jgi:hypothetical protein
MRRHLLAAATFLAATSSALAADDGPIKLKSTFEEHVTRASKEIADKRVALAKKLDKAKRPFEAWEELRLAIRLVPDHHAAREKLGFKRKGSGWEGGEDPPAHPSQPLDQSHADLAKEREALRRESASKLAAIARRGKAGGLDAEARRVALVALDEDGNDSIARGVLGEETGEAPGDWLSERERKIRDAFRRAREKAEKGDPRGREKDVEDALGLGELRRVETAHAVLLASSGAIVDFGQAAKDIEATFASFHYFFYGIQDGFDVDGDKNRVATGEGLKPLGKPRFLFLSGKSEHQQFCERLIKDPAVRAVSLNCAGAVTANPCLIYESIFQPEWHPEWASAEMANYLCYNRLAKDPPRYLVEGVMRWFSGHVSRQANIYSVASGTTVQKRDLIGGPFWNLRPFARGALGDSACDDLAAELAKGPNDLVRLDVALSSAFTDFALAKERAAYVKFLTEYDPKQGGPGVQLEKLWGRPLAKIEEEFRAWVREEY